MDLIRFDDMKRETANRLRTLYEEAFPAEEKKPFDYMRQLERAGKMEILSLMEREELIGLNINMPFCRKNAAEAMEASEFRKLWTGSAAGS